MLWQNMDKPIGTYIWNRLVPSGKFYLGEEQEKDWKKLPQLIKERKGERKLKTPHNLKNPDLESKGGFQREQQFSCPQVDQATLTDAPRAISQSLQPKFPSLN